MSPGNFYRDVETLHCNVSTPHTRTTVQLCLALFCAASFIACSTQEEAINVPPDIRGTITGIIPANGQMQSRGIIAFIRVEGRREADTKYDRADVVVTDTTLIYQQQKGEQTSVKFDAIHTGQSVEASFTGPVLMRYPVQATAGRIVIVERRDTTR